MITVANTDNKIRISLDLETMSLENNAAILQIGAYVFDVDGVGVGINPEIADTFNVYIDPERSEKQGLHVDSQTMDWWNKQNPQLRARVFGGKNWIQDACAAFQEYCRLLSGGEYSRIQLYCNGPEFDLVILKSAFEACHMEWPFHHRSAQSYRTLRDVADFVGMTVPDYSAPHTKHDALADAIAQGRAAKWILDSLSEHVYGRD